jgi:hypothetical protein
VRGAAFGLCSPRVWARLSHMPLVTSTRYPSPPPLSVRLQVGASVSALLIAFDMLNVTEGRLVLMDSQVGGGRGGRGASSCLARNCTDPSGPLHLTPALPAAHVLAHHVPLRRVPLVGAP